MADGKRHAERLEDLAGVVRVPCRPPEPAAQDRAFAVRNRGGSDQTEKGALGKPLEGVLLVVGTAGDRPAEQEDRGGPAEPQRVPGGVDLRCRQPRRPPQRHRVQARIDRDAADDELEADALLEDVEGEQLHAFETEVVRHEPHPHRRVQHQTDIHRVAVQTVVVRGAGHGVQREQRAAEDVHEHLDVDATRELNIPGAPFDPLDPRAPLVPRDAENKPDGKHDAERHRAGHGVPLHFPEPAEWCVGQLQPPDDEGTDKDGNAVQAVSDWCSGRPMVGVAVHALRRQDDVQDQQDRKDGSWGKEAGD